ncbi:DnaJ C-terminal domain-containing protein [Flavimarina sp. Hel_I_48]|uniref:DnaJ C-terminal domain-containing protein n=1 Tax=Flavimarina sp. Hel_I_48 TaxID=1392488 RepID=UPI0004DF0FF4|nr:J domain-containing protein [Flavimarina sp. Hel_I_48]
MEFIDYYKTLELDKSATEADIRKAYRKAARKYHPDLNPNDPVAEQKFKEVNEANEVLSNPENRKKYDQHGKDWQHADQFEQARRSQRYGRPGGQGAGYGQGSDADFSDFFESMFGGAGGRAQNSRNVRFRGQDLNASLQLDLLDVLTTQKRTLTLNGKNIRITVPAGIENEQVIKIKNHGGEGKNGGPNGDLFITFRINNNTAFKRDKSDLFKDVEISLYDAVLGGEIMVDTLSGKVKLKIKEGTDSGTTVKLKGKGFPVYRKENVYGDLYLNYKVIMPKDLSAEERELFSKLAALSSKK